jgi:hypothetical protein
VSLEVEKVKAREIKNEKFFSEVEKVKARERQKVKS